MPRIKVYEQQTKTPELLGGSQSDPSTAGQIGRSWETLGSKISKTGDIVAKVEEQDELSSASVELSNAQLEISTKLNEKLNDGTLKFEEFGNEFDEKIHKLSSKYNTRGGLELISKSSATMKRHFSESALAGVAEIRYDKTKEAFNKSLNNFSNSLREDPSSHAAVSEVFSHYVDNLVNTGGLKAKDAETLRAKGLSDISKSAVRGWISLHPETAKADLEAGKWNKSFNSEVKDQLLGEAERGIRAKEIDRERSAHLKQKGKEANDKVTQNLFLERMASGELSAKEIIDSDLEPVGQGSKEHFLERLKTNLKTEVRIEGKAGTFNSLYYRIHLPENDPNKITDSMQLMSYIGKGLRSQDLGKLGAELRSAQTEDGSDISNLKRQLIDKARKTLTRSNPMYGIHDEPGEEQLLKFSQSIVNKLSGNNPKDVKGMLDPNSELYIGNEINNFVKTPAQIMQDSLSQGRNKKTDAPKNPTNLKLPGETVEQWRKRMKSANSSPMKKDNN